MAHPYQSFLHRLLKPARYLGAEYGAVRKNGPAVRSRFCLAFPDTYELGMSHLGLKVLYEQLNAAPELLCERVFAPWGDLEQELRARGLPLVSLENARPLADFDVVGFSLQYELTYTTVLLMLELGGVPLRAARRAESDPLVLAGGPVASHPEPVAPFFDLVLLGDAEAALPELLRQEADLRDRGAPRADRIAALAERPELYAPEQCEPTWDAESERWVVGTPEAPAAIRRWEPDLAPFPDTGGGPVPSIEAVFDRAAIEIARGCNQGCRFCQAGFLYRPLRERPLPAVLAALEGRAQQGGYDEISLTALSTADYSQLGPLLRGAATQLGPRSVSMSISSLRAIGLDGALLDDLRTGRAGSLTFAPEAGSQRLRDRINKRISEPGLLDTAREVAARGWNHLKLYFMIGLPGERDEDVIAILELAERVRQAARAAAPRRAPRVTCAVNAFVPKPHTPMQWCAMLPAPELERRQALLRKHPGSRRLGLRLHNVPMSLLEGRLARGDRTLAEVVETAYQAGARFDGWEDQFQAARWEPAFAQAGHEPDELLAALPLGGRLPWDHLCIGVEPAFLRAEHRRMERGQPGPACGVPGEGVGGEELACLRCGLPCLESPPPRASAMAPPTPPPATATAGDAEITSEGAEATPEAPSLRLRLQYTKRPPASYLSHLDLVRHVPRILRRAGLRPRYSQGFNPRPRLQFTPPLPVGAEADADLCDVWITGEGSAPPPPTDVLSRLDAVTLPGLVFTAARWLASDEPTVAALCGGARYRFLPIPPLSAARRAPLQQRLQELLARPRWEVQRKPKKKGRAPRVRDVRPSLTSLELETVDTQLAVGFTLCRGDGGSLRPRELLEAIFGEPDLAGRLVRRHHLGCGEDREVIGLATA